MTEEPVSSPPSPQRPHLHVSWLHLVRLWRYRVDKICSQTDMNTWFSVAACKNVEYHQAYCLRLAHRCTGVFPLDNMSRLVCHKRLHHHRIGSPGDMIQRTQWSLYIILKWGVTKWKRGVRRDVWNSGKSFCKTTMGHKRKTRLLRETSLTETQSVSVCWLCGSSLMLRWRELEEKKKLQQCESGLVVSLGTERRLSISEPSAGRGRRCPIKGAGGAAPLTQRW